MLSGTGWRMISLKNFSLSSILLSHSVLSSDRFGFHQNAVLSAISEFTVALPCHPRRSNLDGGAEQPIHLVAKPVYFPPLLL